MLSIFDVIMTKCPICLSEANLTGKEWDYGKIHIKQYKCKECEKLFMEYYGNGEVVTHTISTRIKEMFEGKC